MSKFQSIYIDLYMYVYIYIYISVILHDLAIWHGDVPWQTASNYQRVLSKWMRVKMGCTQTNGRPFVLGIHDVLNHQIWGHDFCSKKTMYSIYLYLFIELFWCFSSSKDNPFTTGCWHLLIPTSELVLGLMPATQGFLKFWIHFFQIPCPKGPISS